jgi:hypothetical protein
MKRGFVVTLAGRESGGVYLAETAGKARYDALLAAREAYPDVTFADLRCTRAPGYDHAPSELSGRTEDGVQTALAEAARLDAWNTHYPSGAPVVVRLAGGGTMETRTRSAAAMIGGRAVVWCEGIPSCYALSHVTPAGEVAGGAR